MPICLQYILTALNARDEFRAVPLALWRKATPDNFSSFVNKMRAAKAAGNKARASFASSAPRSKAVKSRSSDPYPRSYLDLPEEQRAAYTKLVDRLLTEKERRLLGRTLTPSRPWPSTEGRHARQSRPVAFRHPRALLPTPLSFERQSSHRLSFPRPFVFYASWAQGWSTSYTMAAVEGPTPFPLHQLLLHSFSAFISMLLSPLSFAA